MKSKNPIKTVVVQTPSVPRKVKILFSVKPIYYQLLISNLSLKFHLRCIL